MKLKTSVSDVIHRQSKSKDFNEKKWKEKIYMQNTCFMRRTNKFHFVLPQNIFHTHTHNFAICKTICASFTSFIRFNKFQGVNSYEGDR